MELFWRLAQKKKWMMDKLSTDKSYQTSSVKLNVKKLCAIQKLYCRRQDMVSSFDWPGTKTHARQPAQVPPALAGDEYVLQLGEAPPEAELDREALGALSAVEQVASVVCVEEQRGRTAPGQ